MKRHELAYSICEIYNSKIDFGKFQKYTIQFSFLEYIDVRKRERTLV